MDSIANLMRKPVYNDQRGKPNNENSHQKRVTVDRSVKDTYFIQEDKEGVSIIYTRPEEVVNFSLERISFEESIYIELKFDSVDSNIIENCNKCDKDSLFTMNSQESDSYIVEKLKYSKWSVKKLIDDEFPMKLQIKFHCLASHHQQGLLFKLLFFIKSPNNLGLEANEIGNFLIKVCAAPKRDYDNQMKKSIEKENLSSSPTFAKKIKVEHKEDMITMNVLPGSMDAVKKITEFVNSHNGSVVEYYCK